MLYRYKAALYRFKVIDTFHYSKVQGHLKNKEFFKSLCHYAYRTDKKVSEFLNASVNWTNQSSFKSFRDE